MALTFQIVPEVHLQINGSRNVTEIFSDGIGEVWRSSYRGRDTDDRQAIATAHAAVIGERLADEELRNAIKRDEMPALRFQTANEAVARLRELYRSASQEIVCRIARWIRNRVAAGDVTQQQLRNAFGLTQPQWDALKTKMDGFASSLDEVEAAVGE